MLKRRLMCAGASARPSFKLRNRLIITPVVVEYLSVFMIDRDQVLPRLCILRIGVESLVEFADRLRVVSLLEI